jgi:CheY-like chemotaxis protein
MPVIVRSGNSVTGHILSVSYDPTLLTTRELLLQQMGHTVTSVEGFARAFAACESGTKFDLLILGHSIPHDDKAAIIAKAKKTCNCPLLALLRPNESPLPAAERSIDPSEPRAFMEAVREMVQLHLISRKRP